MYTPSIQAIARNLLVLQSAVNGERKIKRSVLTIGLLNSVAATLARGFFVKRATDPTLGWRRLLPPSFSAGSTAACLSRLL